MRETIRVRALESADLDAVVAIDERLTGQTRKEYWRTREFFLRRGFGPGPMVQLERPLAG